MTYSEGTMRVRPRQFWTARERAGLKAMGRVWKRYGDYVTRDYIAGTIRAFVKASGTKKEKT